MNSTMKDLLKYNENEWIFVHRHRDGLGRYSMDDYPVQSSSSNVSNQNDATSATVIDDPAQTTPDGQGEPSTVAPEPACPSMDLLTTENFEQLMEEEVENSVVSLKSKLNETDETLDAERPLSTEFFKQLLIEEIEKLHVNGKLKIDAEMDKIKPDGQRPPATTTPQPKSLFYEYLTPPLAKLFEQLLAETVEDYVVRRGSNVNDEKLPKDTQSMSITAGAVSNENIAISDPENVIGESTVNDSDILELRLTIESIQHYAQFINNIQHNLRNETDRLLDRLIDIKREMEENFSAIGNNSRLEKVVIINDLINKVDDIETIMIHYQFSMCKVHKEVLPTIEKFVEILRVHELWHHNKAMSSDEVKGETDEQLPKVMQSMSITAGKVSNENIANSDPRNVIGAVQSDVQNTTHAINVETNSESTATKMPDPVASECQTTENMQQNKQDCAVQYSLNTKKSKILYDLNKNIRKIEKVGWFLDEILNDVTSTKDSLINKLKAIRLEIITKFAAIGNDRWERCVIVNNLMRKVDDIEKILSHDQRPMCVMSKKLSKRMDKYVEILDDLWNHTIEDSSEEFL